MMWLILAIFLLFAAATVFSLWLQERNLKTLPGRVALDIILEDRYPWRNMFLIGPVLFHFKVQRMLRESNAHDHNQKR